MSGNIILGTLNFDYQYVSEKFTSEKIDNLLNKASSLGISMLDTAFYYNKTESLLGQSSYISNFKIASKANPWFENDFSNGKLGQLSRFGIEHQLTTSLYNLGVDTLESYFLHCWDYQTPIIETLEAFDQQYRKDKFNLFGVSNISPTQLQTIIDICEMNDLSIKPQTYQGMYNMYCRHIEELFPILDDYGIHFQCYNPLAGGLLTGKWANGIEKSHGRFNDNPIYKSIFWNDSLVGETSFLTADIALRWLRNYSCLRQSDSVIIGCSNEQHLLSNVESLINQNPLSQEILDKINDFYKKGYDFQPNYYY